MSVRFPSLWSLLLVLKMLCLYLLGQNCLHLTFKPYLSSETYSRQYEKLPSIVVHACKILQKNVFVENVWPANLALFVYVSTHCVETVKWLDYNRVLSWLGGAVVTHPLWVQEVPGWIPGSGKGFYVWIFVLLLLCFYLFVQKHIIYQKGLQFLLQY